MRRLFRNGSGSVSVYASITIAAVFILNAVLIDTARVKAAEIETEWALKASVRSSLAAYDRKLREYGLFAMTQAVDVQNEAAFETFGRNLSPAGINSFRLLNMQTSQASFRYVPSGRLALHQVFRRQILEEMKYKAPIEFTLGITDKIGKHRPPVQEAKVFAERAQELDRLVKRREESIGDAWKISQVIRLEMEQAYAMNRAAIEEAEPSVDRLNAQAFLLNTYLDEIDVPLHEAGNWDIKIENYLRSITIEPSDPVGESYQSVEVLGSIYFDSWRTELAQLASRQGAIAHMVGAKSSEQIEGLHEMNDLWREQYTDSYNRKEQEVTERQARYVQLSEQMKQAKDQIGEQLNEVKSSLFAELCGNDVALFYERLEGPGGYYETYMEYNLSERTLEKDASDKLDNRPEQIGNDAIDLADRFMSALDRLTEEIYVNEYALTHFNNRTYALRGDADGNVRMVSHLLAGQEGEYILYGLSSCQANLASAYTEMYMIRLGIQTLEVLKNPATVAKGPPMLVFLTALAEAASKAYADMEKLVRGEEVPLVTQMKSVTLSYTDYLRLFMFAHSNDEKKLSRMQGLIHINTGKNLVDSYTTVKAETTASIKLWFMPGIRNLLKKGQGEGGGRSYELHKKAVLSY